MWSRSKKKIDKTLSIIDKKISIILVENSMDNSIKKEFESKYKNVKVIIPKSNNGQGAAFNLAAKKTNKKYLLFMDIDIKIKIITLVIIWRAGIKIDSERLTEICIIFLDKLAISFFTKKS